MAINFLFVKFVLGQKEFKHKRITVFKDGSSFIEKTANVPAVKRVIYFKELPIQFKHKANKLSFNYSVDDNRIILGSLRFSADNNTILESKIIQKERDSIVKQIEYSSLSELLQFNIGKQVSVNSPDTKLSPPLTILKVAENKLITESKDNIMIFDIDKISNLKFVGKAITTKRQVLYESNLQPSVELKLQKESKNQKVNISYMQRGITWLPTYFIDLYDQKKGHLILEANLLNDIEDISNTEINFAVGVPSFKFAGVSSPMASNKNVWEILRQLNNQQIQQFSQGIQMNIMSQRTSYNRIEVNDAFQPQVEGKGGEDLYFYKKQNVSLKKWGRMKVHILSMDFDYEDVYSCELDQNNVSRNYNSESKTNIVWHSIRFKNSSNHPLTTGTVFFKKEKHGQIALISENQLDYTPKDEFITAKMTVAPDIFIKSKDIETARKSVGYDYLLSINGVIDIVNYKSFPVDLIVERKIIGTMLESDKTWKVESNLETYNAKNKSNRVSWKLKIGSGKTIQVKYKYKIMVD